MKRLKHFSMMRQLFEIFTRGTYKWLGRCMKVIEEALKSFLNISANHSKVIGFWFWAQSDLKADNWNISIMYLLLIIVVFNKRLTFNAVGPAQFSVQGSILRCAVFVL